MSFLDLFSDKSDLYASARPSYPDALFRYVASIAPHSLRAWDCGTGNGQAAVGLARYFKEVYASDPSDQQIAHAESCDNVVYSVQPAESVDYPDDAFDAVCVSQALHWFDMSAFFAEAKRVLKPDGVLVVWGYDWFRVSPSFDTTFDEVVMKPIENDWAPQNALLWNGYRDIHLPFVPIDTPDLKICVTWTFYQLLAYVHTWSSVRRCMDRIGTDFFTQAEADLAPHWGDPESVREVTMTLHILAGRHGEES